MVRVNPKLGSLFDGSGGFPPAMYVMQGIVDVLKAELCDGSGECQ